MYHKVHSGAVLATHRFRFALANVATLSALLLLAGCAGGGGIFGQGQPAAVQVANVPLVVQEDSQCAAASLVMASPAAIAHDHWKSLVFTPEREGALPSDMLTAPRRVGLQTFSLDSPQQLPQALQEGYPVIVLLNLRFSWWPQWHYVVVTGYDPLQGEVTLHTGRDKPEHWQMPLFSRLWERSSYWAVVLSKASRLPAFVAEPQAMASAIGLEKAGQLKAAYLAYHTLAQHFPAQCAVYIGMGNTAYHLNEIEAAKRAWQNALGYEDCATAAQNNLAEIES